MNEIPIKIAGYSHTFSLAISFKLDQVYDKVLKLPDCGIFLGYSFLKTIEDCPPDGLRPVYAVLSDQHQHVIGFYYFQIKYFRASQSVRFGEDDDIFCKLHARLKSLVVNLVEFNTLVCGNLLLSGPYGVINCFEYEKHKGLIYQHVIEEMQGWLRAKDIDTNVILVKDFFRQEHILDESTFHKFEIQPNMMVKHHDSWTCFDDYMNELHSKYRVRARRAIKAATPIVRKELTTAETYQLNDTIFELYKCTSTHADFNLIDLHKDYFYQLKKNLGDQCHFYTYSVDGRIIAFYTIIEDGMEAEAHFLGINEDENKKYQIYLNILFDILRVSITLGKSATRFSRTALEIKSSVGAVPHSLTCYIKHRKVINNTFVPYLLDFLNQKKDWVQRHPFKESEPEIVDHI
ncbi:MAG: GNAT family N-acetyltransferase [Saprospiraceae bacterium]